MASIDDKFKIGMKLLVLRKEDIKNVRPIKTSLIFDKNGYEFNIDGLFSNEIFGVVGSDERYDRISYIDLKTAILHPTLFELLNNYSQLYSDIISGKRYAKFDKSKKIFIEVDMNEGETGFGFFLNHVNELKLDDKESDTGKFNKRFIEKVRKDNQLFLRYCFVIPPGYREYYVDNSGKATIDVSNDYYFKIINNTTLLPEKELSGSDKILLSNTLLKIQKSILDLQTHFLGLMDGKNKLIRGQWTKTAIMDGTRNVFTGYNIKIKDVFDLKRTVTVNHTVLGLYQYAKSIAPLVVNNIKKHVMERVFNIDTGTATLIDKKTLKNTVITLKDKTINDWLTKEGIENLINKLSSDYGSNEEVVIDNHYLALLYEDEKGIRLVFDTSTISEEKLKKCKPVRYGELLYLVSFNLLNKYPMFITRYPATGPGSIYPSKTIVKTTMKDRRVNFLSFDGTLIKELEHFPISGEKWFLSFSPHSSKLKGMGADFDGDKGSGNTVYTKESREEIDDLFNKREFYISGEGELLDAPVTDIIKFVGLTLSQGVE